MKQIADRSRPLLAQARDRLLEGGDVPDGAVSDVIARSWRRCAEQGLNVDAPARQDPLPQGELECRREQNQALLHLATPELDTLYGAMLDVGGVVLLTDAEGLVLDARGDPGFVDRTRRVSLQPGAYWSEAREGTNAIGTALAERRMVEVCGHEHFLQENRFLVCTAMPVFDPAGRLAGLIDLSGDSRRPQPHARALLNLAVAHLEHRWVANAGREDMLIGLHPHPAWLGTPHEGIMSFRDGLLRYANRTALSLLDLDGTALGRLSWDDIFGTPGQPGERVLTTVRGHPLYARIRYPSGPPGPSRRSRPASGLSVRHGAIYDAITLECLRKAVRAVDNGLPVLLLGETGTGKELFVRAMHAESRRARAPLVAVNCAAVPESLFESELFGYEEGAFTGARRRGHTGLIRQADGGILFLDEIGDMPLALQAHLLRVLQSGEVMPLGGGRPTKVDFQVVAATNRDLAAAVEAGRFRSDLYYRLKCLCATLPPLRERHPLDEILDAAFRATGAPGRGIRLSAEARDALARYGWPGNLREAANLLRTLVALAEDGTTLGMEDLPGEIVATTAPAPDLRARTDQVLEETLRRHAGNVSSAARELGVHRSTLYRRLSLAPPRREDP